MSIQKSLKQTSQKIDGGVNECDMRWDDPADYLTHDQQNERNEKWLRSVLEGLEASNSSAEALAQRLYEFAWR